MENRTKILAAVTSAVIVGAILALPLQTASSDTPNGDGTHPTPAFTVQYSAKLVCGEIPQQEIEPPFEPELKPGNYATAINIRNAMQSDTRLEKWFVQAISEPNWGNPSLIMIQMLPPNTATEVDCLEIANHLKATGQVVPDLIKGFVFINVPRAVGQGPDPLDVVAVYTSLKEVVKNKIVFEVDIECDEDTLTDEQCKELEDKFEDRTLEIVITVAQDKVIDPENEVKKRLLQWNHGIKDIEVKVEEVDLGVGVGDSIDVEEVDVRVFGGMIMQDMSDE